MYINSFGQCDKLCVSVKSVIMKKLLICIGVISLSAYNVGAHTVGEPPVRLGDRCEKNGQYGRVVEKTYSNDNDTKSGSNSSWNVGGGAKGEASTPVRTLSGSLSAQGGYQKGSVSEERNVRSETTKGYECDTSEKSNWTVVK